MMMTRRDEQMLQWLAVVRVCDLEAVRHALAGFAGAQQPVTLRRAQQWVRRMREAGLVESARPWYRDGAILWGAPAATGVRAPDLLRQTTRHEVCVAAVSARYLLGGWEWTRDEKTDATTHQADGVARRGEAFELVEVELSTKSAPRLAAILTSHTWRLNRSEVSAVRYFGTRRVMDHVAESADSQIVGAARARLTTTPMFDERGRWMEAGS